VQVDALRAGGGRGDEGRGSGRARQKERACSGC
jgi:hypothetical protein